jgi:hypothetical protein
LLSIETATRLFELDPEAGHAALKDCLAGTPNSIIQLRLEAARAEHPQRRSARQTCWDKRRKVKEAPDQASEAATVMSSDPARWWGPTLSDPTQFVPADVVPLLGRTTAGVIYETEAGFKAGGLRLIKPASRWLDVVESVLAQASFFDRYWLVIAEDSPVLMQIEEQLIVLGVRNVGSLSFKNRDITTIMPIPAGTVSVPNPFLKNALLKRKGWVRSPGW